jgi:hypothetical protein
MYPAQALFDGLYTYEDLPDTVFDAINNVFFTKLSSPQTGTGAGAPGVPTTYFLGTDSNNFTVGIGIYSNDDEGPNSGPIWRGSEVANEGEQYGACLFAPKFNDPLDYFRLEDQFADTYTMSYEGASATVTRQSLCTWTGETIDEEGTTVRWRLDYVSMNNPEAPANYKWLVSIQGLTTIGGIKIPPQNSPIGTYGLAGIIVS